MMAHETNEASTRRIFSAQRSRGWRRDHAFKKTVEVWVSTTYRSRLLCGVGTSMTKPTCVLPTRLEA